MKCLKVLLIALIIMPVAANAQSRQSNSTANRTLMEQANKKYPLFDCPLAAAYWKRWIRNEVFTQDDYKKVLDLCIVSYEYLIEDMNSIINETTTPAQRKKLASNLADVGESGDMTTFVRTFSNRMHTLAYEKKLNQENIKRTLDMLAKKEEFKHLNDIIFH